MTQNKKIESFRKLHNSASPLILYNIWDAATAKAAQDSGARALATGSWSVAAAQGYEDGENIPLSFALQIIERIIAQTTLPVSLDFEGGYARGARALADNFKALIALGIAGINFEDQIVGSDELYETSEQGARIHALRRTADDMGKAVYINARTDLFLKSRDGNAHKALLDEAIPRSQHYIQSGADGIFIPGLTDPDLIKIFCGAVSAPVNIMASAANVPGDFDGLGVSRISYGPHPFFSAQSDFKARAGIVLGG